MSWLVKTTENTLEIWTDQEYTLRKEKCKYYGSIPGWQSIRRLDDRSNSFVPTQENSITEEQLRVITIQP